MYKIKYSKQVIKFLQKQKKEIVQKIISIFDELKHETDFDRFDIRELKSFQNVYRLRIGKYRIIFRVLKEELIIEVIKAGSRGDIYK
ncbi:mRNA interferase RelE/StbE [Nitratiruptor sp. YY08-26]|uniref:type II toxin-antitoxin system RelE family toxin n=1 Tax=unclassified Nitratiruptor TaxID=2624044 RepID=UPI0019159A61|nr:MULTISPECIES: type II toxin-antitoxin system RelE/ParE family toxin [unclassified Nitratiruptor]BCD62059.1 mRNA interferase RelE/StbE [Nitratiruptor sp. YY08-13]BCD65995.1 mRNA interferase RelE/StbE [Nitratiruptor sp. YY08-26]